MVLKTVGAVWFGAICLLAIAARGVAAERPNVVFILADDLGRCDLGCLGSTFYETPNLDRLAARGVLFKQAYAACRVCSPTRASIMTGRYPARLHITNYIPGARPGKLRQPLYFHHLPLEEFTLAEAFKAAGYSTAFMGKWHLGTRDFYPDRQGFDINVGGCEKGGPPSYFSPYRIPTLVDGPKGEYLTDRLTDEALAFIDRSSKAKDTPFLLYLAHYGVHVPLQAKRELIEKYVAKAAGLPRAAGAEFGPEGDRQARLIQNRPVYAAMIQSLDESVGRIMDKLAAVGLESKTIVVFTSDNGGLSTAEGSPTSNLPFRAGKGWPYEGGVRVPLLISWPGEVRAGEVRDEPVVSTDYYPTLLELAGLPPRPAQHLDGVGFAATLKAAGGTRPDRSIFWHDPHYSNQGGRPSGAIRAGDFKLVEWFEDERVELFNLADDPGERRELSAAQPERTAALLKQLRDWRARLDASMPTASTQADRDGSK